MNTHGLGQGLRERKKARTYNEIQRVALNLFTTRGYASTTMEEIAAAADVSPSTVFRYFPSKTDLIVTDAWDALVEQAFVRQPRDLTFAQAFKAAMTEAFAGIEESDLVIFETRRRLMAEVPEVRAAMLESIIGAAGQIERLIVNREGGATAETADVAAQAHVLASAFVGIIAVEALTNPDSFSPGGWGVITTSLERLAGGFTL